MALEYVRVVLIRTHYPGNLGATARIMHNFGLHDLVLVAPQADRHDRNARQMSTHGESILDQARIVATFEEAVANCAMVIGTSGPEGGVYRREIVRDPAEVLDETVPLLQSKQRVALVFGPEPSGLTNDEVTKCHWLIHISTHSDYTSVNLAQAVAICLYELRGQWLQREMRGDVQEVALFADQERMFEQMRTALEEIHFLYGPKANTLMHGLRHLLGRANLTPKDVKLLQGLARQIRWYVAKHPPTMSGEEEAPS